ncbi:ATP-dependent RNA helicase DHX29 [Podospora aff. communis PSN243]|uniref:RNA helicase n=1 Tax=Podospora aff. communis PSN243 TaxID=3040156 RepID=A0AAV9G2Z0_9PEZI|nr:ATP-dependent RNA helicase DHX29 [Podospora aff. communis PSN243]
MAGKKKTKKPAANPARGFATTSVASKPRADVPETADETLPGTVKAENAPQSRDAPPSGSTTTTAGQVAQTKTLSPEEFERRLEESELQLLVEKYAQKVRRDAQRQRTRLETDRRLLRGQAESLNAKKWLPQELMDHVLDLIQAEGRFAASSVSSDGGTSRLPAEEDLTIKLWTLQQTLAGSDCPQERIQPALQYALDIAPNISVNPKSESIWGLEEVMDWLARECERDELPDYTGRVKTTKSQTDTPLDSPIPSGATTPKFLDIDPKLGTKLKNGALNGRSPRAASPRKTAVTYDEDIEPDQLLPFYLETKAKLFDIQRPRQDAPNGKGAKSKADAAASPEEALLLAKIDRVEKDVLFDKYVGEQQWRAKRIVLEKEYAAAKKKKLEEEQQKSREEDENDASGSDDVNAEAERIAAEILAEEDDDDQALADLFSSLPVNEVDPTTGKSSTVMNGADGSKVTIRDFGKWSGVSPMRALEEACRSRDSSVRISYHLLSDVAFANRHAVKIQWSKSQEIFTVPEMQELEIFALPTQFVFKMMSIATPDSKQSEAYIATTALFFIFGSSAKDEKVSLRLPAAWKDLWSEFAEAKKEKADAQDRATVKHLRDLVRKRAEQELEDGVLIQGAFKGRGTKNLTDSEHSDHERAKRAPFGPEYYQNIWIQKYNSPRFQHMLHSRAQLPMWQFRQQVVDTVEREQVVIICGETGCGKSTQVPSFLLEHQLMSGKPCKIYCTEPRRISAISLARRVSEELGEGKGDLGTSRSLVGYSIRLESNTSRETRLVYATTGIVMRMLEGSNDLQEITHLVLDEVHERSIDSDFLLIVLKKLLLRRKDLKVVLMSATVDAEKFSAYLGNAPVLTVPGRTFPVTVAYLEDAVELTGYTLDQRAQEKVVELDDDLEAEADKSSKPELIKELKNYSPRTRNTLSQMDEYRIDFDLIVQLIARIAVDPVYIPYSKAILVFLPGIAEIRTLNDILMGDRAFAESWLVYPLHSTIATEEQESAFLVPPPGMRKIVLATNIAETGITIPDVTCVIDTGKHREMRFDERRQLSRLIDTFISRANAKQRRGRAGRVQEGLCFHLFTKYRHDNIMSDQQTPEMLRLSLQDLAIRVKICKIGGIEETLGQALDPPSAKNIRRAIDALVDVRALTASSEELTPLGLQLARLPLDVFLGKLILMGAVFKCLDMAITVAAILSSKSPFVAPFGQRNQADTIRKGFRKGDSDLLTVYNAYTAWKRVCQAATGGGAEFQFCRKNFLSPQTLGNIEDLKGQLLNAVIDSGFLQITTEERQVLNRLRYGGRRRQQIFFEVPKRVNINSENDTVCQSVIAWSFYPKLLVRDVPGGKGLRNVGNNQNISLHPSSVNKGNNELRWLSYYHIMQSKGFYNAHETTAVDAFPIALLCGDVRADLYSGVLILDGNRARFAAPDWKTMLVMKVLRARLREMLTRSFKNPGKLPTAQHERWLEVWQRIFTLAQESKDKASA